MEMSSVRERAAYRQEERMWFLEKLNESVRMLYKRDILMNVRAYYKKALNMRMMSDSEYMMSELVKAMLSRETFFLLLGVLVPMVLATFAALEGVSRVMTIAGTIIVVLALRTLYVMLMLNRKHKISDYAKFRKYMKQNRDEVERELAQSEDMIRSLNTQIADERQCIIPAAYHDVAGELLYIAKSGLASDMQTAISTYEHQRDMDEIKGALGDIQAQNEQIREDIWNAERDQNVFNTLLMLHLMTRK